MHWIDEAKRYIGFSADDEARLRAFHERAQGRYDEIIDHFYEVIDRHDGARRVITGGDPQRERLKCTLLGWFESGLAGAHDLAWYETRARIGRRHVSVGLESRYVFTAVNVVRTDLHRLVRELGLGSEAGPTIDSIDRWLDLELAIMEQTYQEDTAQRLVERERDAQTERVTAMQRMSAGLAHEVRNPLNAAQLQLQLLARRLRRSGADAGLLEVTALVDGEIRRLSGLLQEFLDFARPVQLSASDTDVVSIARQVIEVSAASAAARGVTVALDGDPSVAVCCDEGKVHQVLQNVIGNAVEAAGSHVQVEVRADPRGAVVRIRDDGPGIPDAVAARIYEPFFSTKEHGTGMGLSIAYSLIALHGGTISTRNRGGAEFTIVLPMIPPPMEVVQT